jgi:septum formation protein
VRWPNVQPRYRRHHAVHSSHTCSWRRIAARRRLLEWLNPFEVTAVDTPEDLDSPLAADPEALAAALAAEKADAVRDQGLAREALVMCFDTIVVHNGAILGKPGNRADAWRMLRELSGTTHQVVTGVALLCPGDETPTTFSVVTNVTMRPLSDRQIEDWMAEATFMGCAGAYNIEAQVADVSLEECYQNVAGIPLCHLYSELRDVLGCTPAEPSCPVEPCDVALHRTCVLGPRVTAPRAAEPPR